LHPAVLRLIAQTIKECGRARVPVAVCGEVAGELEMTELLLGMGLRQYSMHPSQILPLKERLFTLSTKDSARLAARVLRQSDPVKIKAALVRAANANPS
jgi:phosphotransferase system enzyme I (PtsI)